VVTRNHTVTYYSLSRTAKNIKLQNEINSDILANARRAGNAVGSCNSVPHVLFADDSLPDYDESAATLPTRARLAILDTGGES
jgi:hypothetical protein